MKFNVHFWSYLAHFSLEWELFQIKVVMKIEAHILCSKRFTESRAVYEIRLKNMVELDRPQKTIKYGACAVHAG